MDRGTDEDVGDCRLPGPVTSDVFHMSVYLTTPAKSPHYSDTVRTRRGSATNGNENENKSGDYV